MNERTHKADQWGYRGAQASLSHVMGAVAVFIFVIHSCSRTTPSPTVPSDKSIHYPSLADCISWLYLVVVMSTQNNHLADTLQHRPYPHIQSNDSKEFEGSCDTLIDVNGLPYTSNSRHQTFTVATPTTSRLQRGFSIPLSKFSSKQSDDTHETSGSHPSVVSPPSEVDVPSLWQRVSRASPFLSAFLTHLTRLCPSPLLAVSMLQRS